MVDYSASEFFLSFITSLFSHHRCTRKKANLLMRRVEPVSSLRTDLTQLVDVLAQCTPSPRVSKSAREADVEGGTS